MEDLHLLKESDLNFMIIMIQNDANYNCQQGLESDLCISETGNLTGQGKKTLRSCNFVQRIKSLGMLKFH